MNTANAYMTVSEINVDVVHKDIKNLHIAVYLPLGRVCVAAPHRLTDEAIRLVIVQRLPGIKRQRERLQNANRQSLREMVSGESYYVWGTRLRLEVIEKAGRSKIDVSGSKLRLYVSPDTDAEKRRRILDAWYRNELKAVIPDLIEKWEPVIGKSVSKWTVRRMKTKWGSCNPDTAHLSFNFELAKKHPSCLEYIVVHEMTHLQEGAHNDHFLELLHGYLPGWQALRGGLNRGPLVHEEWLW